MQVAEVNKALGSISYLVDRGYKVVFDKCMRTGTDTSMMIKKSTMRAAKFRRDRNIWVLDAYVDVVEDAEGGLHPLNREVGFRRHG